MRTKSEISARRRVNCRRGVAVSLALLCSFEAGSIGLQAQVAQPYEGFGYASAGGLLGQNGGSGFSGSWSIADASWPADHLTVANPGLSFGLLSVSGNRVASPALQTVGGLRRALNVPMGTPGTRRYISLLLRPEGVLNQGAFNGFFGVYLNSSVGRDLFIGKPGGDGIDRYVLEERGGFGQRASNVRASVGQPALLVVRLDFLTGLDRFTLFVNPVPGLGEPTTGTVKDDLDVGQVDALTLFSSGAFSADEVRLGLTFDAVVPWVRPDAPVILVPPSSQATRAGGEAFFEVRAVGAAPLTYQWRFNDTEPIPGAESFSLLLTSVQSTDAGRYSVVVRNAFGSVTSQVAVLTVAESLLVTGSTDSGPGSLRQAILDANALPGRDRIEFEVLPAGSHVIRLNSALPTLTGPVELDATTQPGFDGLPKIALDGANAGFGVFGLTIGASNCLVRGLAIHGFSEAGLLLLPPGSARIEGNLIGTDLTGSQGIPNGTGGIWVYDSPNNVIGGRTAQSANVISANGIAGIELSGSTSGTRVQGNLIGTDRTGTRALGNDSVGVLISNSSSNVVGGAEAESRNIISANTLAGVLVYGALSRGNVIQGNYIGTQTSGLAAMGNQVGVLIENFASENQVRGNLISGNEPYDGIRIHAQARQNQIDHNWIGLDATGRGALGNGGHGVFLFTADNVVGPGNAISGNQGMGILLEVGATSNRVVGNRIGTDAFGEAPVANGSFGVLVLAARNTIGGTNAELSNLISGNDAGGINLWGAGAIENQVLGNLVGTDVSGTRALGNGGPGITIASGQRNTLGGAHPAWRNVISGNGQSPGFNQSRSGISLEAGASGNQILGNYVGTDSSGTSALPNREHGVSVQGSSTNMIGPANLISGNQSNGVWIAGPGASQNTVAGNWIGLDSSGISALPNRGHGIHLEDASGNFVGAAEESGRNVISGNGLDGVLAEGTDALSNRVQNNYIGTDSTGMASIGNGGDGIHLRSGASLNTIGASTSSGPNVVSGNTFEGVHLEHPQTRYNHVLGNFIGTDAAGQAPLGNGGSGVRTSRGASQNTIGGIPAGARNVIAFNGGHGVWFRDGTQNLVRNNRLFGNQGLGLNLDVDWVTPNDADDADEGANQRQNFPLLASAIAQADGTVLVTGVVGSLPAAQITLEFFANDQCDPSGHGEGLDPLGTATVLTEPTGQSQFQVVLQNGPAPGMFLTATATDPLDNTSEFSPCMIVVSELQLKWGADISAGTGTLSWPMAATETATLQWTDELEPPIHWTTVTNGIEAVEDQWQYRVNMTNASLFFRLVDEP